VSTTKRPSLLQQVRADLLKDLTDGTFAPGAKLPNEMELADRYAVSRATVREAVLSLMDAGYLNRRHGSGTYVTSAPRTRHPLETSVSYTEMIREAGLKPGETVLARGERAASDEEATQLGLADDEELLLEVERVRLAGKRPVIYSLDRIPLGLLAGLAEDASGESSLYRLLERAGHPVARASARLLPVVATAKLARLLAVKRGTPLLHIDQVDYDARGRAVMLSHEWHVADAFELIVNRRSSTAAD
jgi:DNA-binding GntR family transcriptional regulator